MKTINPVNKFFKTFDQLNKEIEKWCGEGRKWGCSREEYKSRHFSYSHDSDDASLEEHPAGFHIGNISGTMQVAFFFRIPQDTYCCRGRPHFTFNAYDRFTKESENEKVIYEQDGYEYIFMWTEWSKPTSIIWGTRPEGFCYALKKDGEILVQEETKIGFKREASKVLGLDFKDKKRSKYSRATQTLIKRLEGSYGHSAHCEHQVQICYKPADPENMFCGWETWKNAVEPIANQIERLLTDEDLKGCEKANLKHVALYYRDKLIYNDTSLV